MKKMTHHPLRAQESALKRALVLGGFELIDDAQSREIVPPEWDIKIAKYPHLARKPVMLEQGYFMLRTDLLASQLADLKQPLPLKKFATGVIYDGNDAERPNRLRIQGIWADKSVPTRLWLREWDTVVREAFGLEASFTMTPTSKDSHRIDVQVGGREFTLANIARATFLPYSLLGLSESECKIWFFDIDVDAVACGYYGIADRSELYSLEVSKLERFTDDMPTYGNFFTNRAIDLLRERGFVDFYGPRFYDFDCYKCMHMIQEGWDRNNDGMRLVEPMGSFVWMPTVLTPSLEEALAANYKAGKESCRMFEIAHIYVPHSDTEKDFRSRSTNKKYSGELGPRKQTDKFPRESIALSFGAYGPDLTDQGWVDLVSEFFDAFGVKEHYYFDTMKAKAYNTLDAHLVMNDKMRYLMSNFGRINSVALENYGIGVPAYMAQFEFTPIEQEAAWEMIFVPIEYR